MKFNILIEELLSEALTPKEIYNKYYNDIPFKTFEKIVKSDPNTKLDVKGDLKKIGKYSKILLNMFKTGNLKLEDLPRSTEYLGIVYKYNISLDIKNINTIPDIYNQVEKYLAQEETDFFNIVKQLDPSEYQLVFNSDEWVIYVPKTERAACYLGVNTQWCTTWGKFSLDKSYRERQSHFKRHNDQGPLYVIVKKDNTNIKYQFHFETKQYMDKSDRRINTQNFLDDNDDIRNFFFPSLTKDVSKEQLKIDIKRFDVLSSEYGLIIMKKSIGPDGLNNKLVRTILDDKENIRNFINDENISEIDFEKNYILFYVKDLDNEIDSVNNVLSYYRYDIDQSYDRMYEDIRNDDHDNLKEKFESILEDYYNKNQNNLKYSLGVINFEQFSQHYLDSCFESNEENYYQSYANINYSNFETGVQEAINEIEKYIVIDNEYRGHSIKLNLIYFTNFLVKEDINEINQNLYSIIDEYISTYNIQTEYEFIYPNTIENPTYDKHSDITNAIDNYFEKILENDDEINKQCLELRKKLTDVVNNIFKRKNVFDNEHVHIELPNYKIDCEDGSIMIKYHNKDTNKKYEGKIKVDNLASYTTNYQLFETYVTYKKNI